MKGRSSRLPTSDPPDDWVNGSWTVDCICGVNFDDGEEMVNCDECGVWVHTRCSRYVKGEKSFACDKCKIKISRNNSEETEVAQLLIELPTKTIKMSNPYPVNNVPSWRPYGLWNDKPIEERGHVQGVPGGDPSLFHGFSSIFTSELWKSSGYVPKKFNFRYKEFPCWENQQDVDSKADGENENVISKGAGVLYSLSKETFGASRAQELVTMTGQIKVGGSDKTIPKERNWEDADAKNNTIHNSTKKEKLRSTMIQCGKRSREDSGPSKDQTVKKKNRSVQRDHDKRDKVHTFKTVVVHSTNDKQVDVSDAKVDKVLESEVLEDKHEHGKNAGSLEVASTAQLFMGGSKEKPTRNAVIYEENNAPRSCEVSGLGYSSHKRVKAEKLGHEASDSAKSEELTLPALSKDAIARNSMKKEGQLLLDSNRYQGVQLEITTDDLPGAMALSEVVVNSALEVQDTEVKLLGTGALLGFGKTKLGAHVDIKEALRNYPSDTVAKSDCLKDFGGQVQSDYHESETFKVNETGPTTSPIHEHEGRDASEDVEVTNDRQFENVDKITDDSSNSKLRYEGLESSLEITKTPSELKEFPKGAGGDAMKQVGTFPSSPPSHRKTVSAGKSSSSTTIVISKSSLSDRNRTGNSQNPKPIGKEITSNSSTGMKKESDLVDPFKGQGKHEKTKSAVKANPKSSLNSVLKASQASRATNTPTFKHYTSVGKDSSRHMSSKSSSVESFPHPLDISDPTSAPTQHTVHGPIKNIISSGQQRGEKASQSNLQSSSKCTHSSPAGLSDEELALLLHQELNSSPRVPRVPRVRHTGSLPQTSPTSMLIKRASSSGGKEQHTFSRRKSKDVHKDGSRSSLEHDTEARKGDRVLSPLDSAKTSGSVSPGATNPELSHSLRKNIEQVSAPAANSGLPTADANELKVSSMRGSPLNTSDADSDGNRGLAPTHQTLPALIAEIMGKGRRMTYEELCNAVLPHWQNLRKHNGERYAYSSHSQAVLDCLRNRTEWAQLVDRGPKTNASRKKRKMDSEAASTESEDGEGKARNDGESKSFDSNKEEFPKGRRKARKGRRLALQGRNIRNERRKLEAGSDHTGSLSDSGDDSASSEDGSHGSGLRPSRSGVSASSDEIRGVS